MTAATVRSYRPGEWFGILGEHATVLLPPSEKARVAGLWSLVDDGAGFDAVLDALISGGLRDLPGFVLVSTGEDETTVVIRGEATARFDTDEGEVEVDGAAAATWAERSLFGVTAVRLVVGEAAADAPAYRVAGGLVRVSEVSAPPETVPAAEVELPPSEPAPPPPVSEDLPDTGPQAVVHEAPPGPIGPEPDWTLTPPEPPIGVPSGPPPPVAPAWGAPSDDRDHDGLTHAVGPPARGPEDAQQGRVSRPVARLVFSHGDDVSVEGTVLVGRAPEARRHSTGEQPRLVTVPSPGHEISSTHLEVRPGTGADHDSAVVTDLGSTNGTVLVQPGLAPEELQPGIAVQLIPGAIIDLGDGVTIQVINP